MCPINVNFLLWVRSYHLLLGTVPSALRISIHSSLTTTLWCRCCYYFIGEETAAQEVKWPAQGQTPVRWESLNRNLSSRLQSPYCSYTSYRLPLIRVDLRSGSECVSGGPYPSSGGVIINLIRGPCMRALGFLCTCLGIAVIGYNGWRDWSQK